MYQKRKKLLSDKSIRVVRHTIAVAIKIFFVHRHRTDTPLRLTQHGRRVVDSQVGMACLYLVNDAPVSRCAVEITAIADCATLGSVDV